MEEIQNIIIYLTHYIDDSILKYVKNMQSQLKRECDVWILYDTAKTPIDVKDYPDVNIWTYNHNDYKYFWFNDPKVDYHEDLPNLIYPIVDFCDQMDKENFLIMENDIIFTGNWKDFWDRTFSQRHDYVHIATDITGCYHAHWPYFVCDCSKWKHTRFAWSQMYIMSKKFANRIKEVLKENENMFFEILLPTIGYNENFDVGQFENFGSFFKVTWGPKGIYDDEYKNNPQKDTFYHPIKDLSIV